MERLPGAGAATVGYGGGAAEATMLLLVPLALAGNPPPPPIVNGSTTDAYPQVVTLVSYGGDYGYNFCSGTLIAEQYVVTAAHCVEAFDDNEEYGYDQHYVFVGYDLEKQSGVTDYAEVSSWKAHPDYEMNGHGIFNDIGVIKLASKITSVDPMPVNKDSIKDGNLGDDYRYVGWGVTTDGGEDSTKKRTADIPLDNYDATYLYGYDDDDKQNVCQGDSGGAALEMLGGGAFELAGVNSFVYSPNGDSTPCQGGASGATRVDKFIDWIENYTPVYSYAELYGDADTDADSDADADSDGDSDTDLEDFERSGDGGDDDDDEYEASYTWNCAAAGPPALGAASIVMAMAFVRRRR